MKPVIIKQNDQMLMQDKIKKYAEIKITQDCKFKPQILDYFISQMPAGNSLHLSITDTLIKDKEQYTNFLQLRDSLLVKLTTDCKSLNNISINYKFENLGQQSIKKVVTFIQTVQGIAKVVGDCSISISYSQSLMNYENILETINNYFSCIAGSITSFSLRLLNDLSKESLLSLAQLFHSLKNIQKFFFYISTSLNLRSDENLAQFVQSMQSIVKSAHHFEIDMGDASYQRGVISSLPEQLSLLISQGGDNLKTVIINLEKVGWTFDRQKLIKSNFVFGLSTMMHKWPSSIKNLSINLDRALSYNENIIGDNIKNLLENLQHIIPQLESFELNLNGIGFSVNEFKVSFAEQLTTLFDQAKNLTSLDLKLSGHLDLYHGQWERLFQSISKIPALQKLVLDIERWKNYQNDLEIEDQETLINNFLDDLYKYQNNTLKKFHFNMDDWKYLEANSFEYTQKLMRFKYVDDFQLLWYKSQHKDSLKNVELLQSMSSQVKRETMKQILLKKIGIKQNKQELKDFEELEDEALQKHMAYFHYLNRRVSKNSPTFQNIANKPE